MAINFGHFEGFDDRIPVVLNIRKKRVVRSVAAFPCNLRVGEDALQVISLISVHNLRDQKAATRVTPTNHLRVLAIDVHVARADLSEQKAN